MRIGQRTIGTNEPPYIVAELGVNHDGSPARAQELVEAAREAGADAVKVQWFETDRLLSRAARLARYQRGSGADDPVTMLQSLQLDAGSLAGIAEFAAGLGLHTVATLFSVEHVETAASIGFDAFKTASPDVINRPLIESLIATGRPLLVSTGAATLPEIQAASDWLGDHPHVLLHCVSAYPTPDASAALAGRAAMCQVNAHALGYSDHTTAVDTGALAVASGARLLEKHLTYDRGARGPDHATSLAPPEFAQYVRLARRAWQMLGPPRKCVLDIERDVREVSRQSLTSRMHLPAGHVLAAEELTIKRPGTGIAPWRLAETVGRRLAKPVGADMPLHDEDLA